jgi:transposase
MKKKKHKIINKHLEYVIKLKYLFYSLNNCTDNYVNFLKNKKMLTDLQRKFHVYIKIHKIQIIKPTIFCEIDKDQTNVPFWNDKIKILSDKLFLPSEFTLEEDKKYISHNTWFKSEFYKETHNCFHLEELNYSPNNEIKDIKKTRKIMLYPNIDQVIILKKFLGAYRYFYNRTISFLKNYDKLTRISFYLVDPSDKNSKIELKIPKDKDPYNFYNVRPILKDNEPEWFKLIDFPSHEIDQAIKEAIKNTLINLEQYVKKKRKFETSFKSKKDIKQTFNIEKCYIKKDGIFKNNKLENKFVFRNLKMNENISDFDYCDSSITYHRILNKFTLNLTYNSKTIENKSSKICALDPGVKNFMTLYSDTKVAKIGVSCKDKIYKICKEIDIIKSRIDSKGYYVKNDKKEIVKEYVNNHNRRRNLKKALHRKIKYLNDIKKELHNQTINYLCKNYSKVIIPPFETQNMVGNLNSKTARLMNTLSFYEFRIKLIEKGLETNTKILVKPEYYTSKTCTQCGHIDHNLGNADIYNCIPCGLEIERDYNGARNIMLRTINEWALPLLPTSRRQDNTIN